MSLSAVPPSRPPKPKILKPSWPSVVSLGAIVPIIPANCWYGDWRDELGTYEFNKFTAIKKEEGGNGLYDAVRGTPEQLAPLFGRAKKWNMVGMRMGAAPDGSGLDLLDLDFLKHPESRAWWEENKHKFGPTPIEHTPGGGVHLYIKHRPGQKNIKGSPVPGIDVRGDEGLSWVWALNGYPTENFHLAFSNCCEWPTDIGIPLSQSSGGDRKKRKSNRDALISATEKNAPHLLKGLGATPEEIAAAKADNVVPFQPKAAADGPPIPDFLKHKPGADGPAVFSRPAAQGSKVADALQSDTEQFDRDPPPNTPENRAWVRELLNAIPGTEKAFLELVAKLNEGLSEAEKTPDRDVWLNIGRAVHWFDAGDDGYELFVEFSERYKSWFDEGKLNTQWASFHTENRDRPITLGTLIHIAKTAGWASRPEPQPPAPDPDKPWQHYAMRGENGQMLNNLYNVQLAIERAFPNRFAYDELTCLIRVNRKDPLKDVDILNLQVELQLQGLKRIGKDCIADAVERYAHAHPYHPVRDELNGLKWDGTIRVNDWATTYLGCENNLYTRAVAGMFLISMVARQMQPGCKVDHMLILEGPQGKLKSTALKVLCGAAYFSDALPDISTKDASQHMRGRWVIEIPEMHTFDRADINRLKDFLTRVEERFRPPYGRQEVVEPRQCVFAGTMNPIGNAGYLRDPTGGRRFWPLTIGTIDIPALRRDREQLLAEAMHLYKAGAIWWPSAEFEKQYIEPEQKKRREDDVWREQIGEWLDKPTFDGQRRNATTVLEVAQQALGIGVGDAMGAAAKIGRREQNRIMAALTDLGWVRGSREAHARWWVRKE